MSTENQPQLQASTTPAEKVKITTAKLRELMLGGMNRKEIAVYFGAPVSTINKFFNHPDLSDLRPKHKSGFELVDGTGTTFSPGALAQAKKEKKAANAANEAIATEEVNEVVATNGTLTESVGI